MSTFAHSKQTYYVDCRLLFLLPDPKLGCQPADAPFWLGAAAIVLIFSFLGFLDSRLPLAIRSLPWLGYSSLVKRAPLASN